MAADADRAERLKQIKRERPALKWRHLAEAADVSERSVLEWAKTGQISYDHAKKVAHYLKIELDWLWRGPEEAADLMAALSLPATQNQLERIERKVDVLVRRLAPDDAADLERELDEAGPPDVEPSAGSGQSVRAARQSGKAR